MQRQVSGAFSPALAGAYPAARLAASAATGLPAPTLPETCPFALDELLAERWLP